MDLFDQQQNSLLKPLAEQMRPKTLAEFVGQKHLLGPGKLLSELLSHKSVPSLIFWGPPGVGKTTLARLIAQNSDYDLITLSAVDSGIKEVKEVIAGARDKLRFNSRQTILFIDEIHRFNKAQQDAFLPHVENGTITLIGATTENPSFEVISALLSRCQVITLTSLSHDELNEIVQRALNKKGKEGFLSDEAAHYLIESCHGDARYLLNIVDDLLNISGDKTKLEIETVRELTARRSLHYDKNAEHHYNVISAFIKSMRGSDPDAAVYYLARMLEGGEDPLFIARRMIIFASEDISNANPQAVEVAIACMQSYDFIGKAEGWIPLAHCACYLASSPKSNASYMAYKAALADVQEFGALEVPLHLRNAPTKLMKNIGYGKDYQYAHNQENAKVTQTHLPDKLVGRTYYHPTDHGHEKKLKEWLKR